VVLFIVSGLVHLGIWRVRRPLAYPIWLPAIFLSSPVVICLALMITSALLPRAAPSRHHARNRCQGTVVYGGGPHALFLRSPPAIHAAMRVLWNTVPLRKSVQAVERHTPSGIAVDKLEIPSLTEQALTGKRIHHLLAGEMIHWRGNRLILTFAGQRVVNFWKFYRKVFGIVLAN